MSFLNAIGVAIRVDGIPLPEYISPLASEADQPRHRFRYIETMNDAAFTVNVFVPHDFPWLSSNALGVTIDLDGANPRILRIFKSYVKSAGGNGRWTGYTGLNYFDAEKGKPMMAPLLFKQLQTNEEDIGDKPSTLQGLGSIEVSVRREIATLKGELILDTLGPPTQVSQVPEKIVAKHGIDSSIRLGTPEKLPWCTSKVDGEKLPRPDGRSMRYTFFYRSRHFLQFIGCIPGAPVQGISLRPATVKDEGNESRGGQRIKQDGAGNWQNVQDRDGGVVDTLAGGPIATPGGIVKPEPRS